MVSGQRHHVRVRSLSGNKIASGLAGTSCAHSGLAASTTWYADTNQASATTQAAGASCHVVYTVTTQWNVGFGTALAIQNTGTAPVNGWRLTWTWAGNQQITQAWNANYTQSGANATLTNASWNPAIAPGATISGMGFNGSYSGSNGTLCHSPDGCATPGHSPGSAARENDPVAAIGSNLY